jgi:hypothetical protein
LVFIVLAVNPVRLAVFGIGNTKTAIYQGAVKKTASNGMKFTSESGAAAGAKSKRGASRMTQPM